MEHFHYLVLSYLDHMIDEPVIDIFTWAVVADIVTGIAKSLVAKKTNNMTISSKGLKGLITHGCVILIVLTLFPIASAMGFHDQMICLIAFYVVIYCVSIVENLGEMGVPIPSFLKNHLAKLQDDYDHGTGQVTEKGDNANEEK